MTKVKNAIIFAAQKEAKLRSFIKNTPKPLLAPRNKPLIEDIIEKLHEKGITEIIIVVGYLHEKFEYLKEKYNVTLILNEKWNTGSTLTSLYKARDYLGDSLIIDGGIFLSNNVFQNRYRSSIIYVETNEYLDSWLVNVSSNGTVQSFLKNGKNKIGLFNRKIIFVTNELAKKVKGLFETLDSIKNYEMLILQSALTNSIDFKVYKVAQNMVFDLDTAEKFNNFRIE